MGLKGLIKEWWPWGRHHANNFPEVADYLNVLDGTGAHAAHARVQDGKYVRCSCGTVAVGRMEKGEG